LNDVFSEKQTELVSLLKHEKLRRINLLEGSVRSGKTWISLLVWALWVGTMPADASYLMVAKTLTSLRRNCLDLLQSLVGTKNFKYNLNKKEGRLFGRLVYLEGVNDARAESKIRGMTLQGAYCDELTLFSEDFFSMLLSRLSLPGAKLFATTNPDNPQHWLMEKYIKRCDELDMLVQRYTIDDNPFLDPAYVASLKKEYTGVFYDRFIRGLWCVAEGLIFDMYDDSSPAQVKADPGPFAWYFAACDYGTQNPCTFGLYGVRGDGSSRTMHLIREYYYDGRKAQRQKTDGEYAQDFKTFIGETSIRCVVVDPSAASFIAQLRKDGWTVRPAKNDVLDGIRLVAQMIAAGRFTIDPGCQYTRQERLTYAWDPKATERGEDKPLKENDHTCDRDRYACQYAFGRQAISFD